MKKIHRYSGFFFKITERFETENKEINDHALKTHTIMSNNCKKRKK